MAHAGPKGCLQTGHLRCCLACERVLSFGLHAGSLKGQRQRAVPERTGCVECGCIFHTCSLLVGLLDVRFTHTRAPIPLLSSRMRWAFSRASLSFEHCGCRLLSCAVRMHTCSVLVSLTQSSIVLSYNGARGCFRTHERFRSCFDISFWTQGASPMHCSAQQLHQRPLSSIVMTRRLAGPNRARSPRAMSLRMFGAVSCVSGSKAFWGRARS